MAQRTKLTEREKARILEMLDDGLTQKQVAARMGITPSLVSYYARRGKVGTHGGARPGAGRAKLPAGQKRSKTVSIRFTPSQHRLLNRLARQADAESLSTYLYDLIADAIDALD